MSKDKYPKIFSRQMATIVYVFRDFTTLFCVILRRGSSEWLESSSIESDLDMRFAIWNSELAFQDFSFFKHSF